jgi:hypothetical protein
MNPIVITELILIFQFFVIVFYEKYERLQCYPKIYEDGIGIFFIGVLMILIQLDKNNKKD